MVLLDDVVAESLSCRSWSAGRVCSGEWVLSKFINPSCERTPVRRVIIPRARADHNFHRSLRSRVIYYDRNTQLNKDTHTWASFGANPQTLPK